MASDASLKGFACTRAKPDHPKNFVREAWKLHADTVQFHRAANARGPLCNCPVQAPSLSRRSRARLTPLAVVVASDHLCRCDCRPVAVRI